MCLGIILHRMIAIGVVSGTSSANAVQSQGRIFEGKEYKSRNHEY
jgi:hypothetical protein